MARDGTYFLGEGISKRKDSRAPRCDCGEPGIGYIAIKRGHINMVWGLGTAEIKTVAEIPKCRTHYLAVEEKLIDPNIELKG